MIDHNRKLTVMTVTPRAWRKRKCIICGDLTRNLVRVMYNDLAHFDATTMQHTADLPMHSWHTKPDTTPST